MCGIKEWWKGAEKSSAAGGLLNTILWKRNVIQTWRNCLIVVFELANAKTDLASVSSERVLKGDKSRGDAC